jgi:ethanolamine ammonia-lyase small subunit
VNARKPFALSLSKRAADKEKHMTRPGIGDKFPSAKVKDIDGATVEFPQVFTRAPATVIFFYRGRW